ncbi:MAG: flagellar basal body-associated FliL family protein [Pseudomonadota bacterium]
MAKKKQDLNLGKDGADEEKGGKGKMIIIIAAVVLLLGGGAAAFFLMPGGEEGGGEGAEEVVEEKPDEPLYLDMKKLLVNIEYDGRTHYVQAEMQLMSYYQEVIDQAFRDRPAIRDRLIILFNGQDFAALKTVEGKEALRADALVTVNEALGLTAPKVIEEVYFENFVLQ